MAKTVPYEDFQKMVRLAPPNSGITPEAIAASLEKKGYTLAPELSRYSSVQPKEKTEGRDGFFSAIGSGLMKTAEYVASPLGAAAGLITKGIGAAAGIDVSAAPDVQNLQKNAEMARTSLPLTVGLATAPLSLPAGALATGIAGFAGRGMKETADAVTGKDQQSAIGRFGQSVGEGVLTGLTDLAAGKVLKYGGKAVKNLFSPLAGRFDSEIAQLAANRGIKLPVSAMSDSNVVRSAEAASQKGLFGGDIETMIDTASKKLTGMADDLVKSMGGSDDLTIAGKSVLEGANTYRESWRALKNNAYKMADDALSNSDIGAFIPNTKATQDVIGEILSGKQAATGLLGDIPMSDATTGILQTLYKNLQGGATLPLKAYTSALDELNQLTKFGNTLISTGDQAVLKKVIAVLDDDVTNGLESIAPKAAKALRKADDIYIKGIKLLDSSFGENIAKLSDNPTKIVDQLIKPNSVDDVPRIFELIGKGKNGQKRINDVRSAFAKKLLSSGTSNETGDIMGKTLANKIAAYGESTVKSVLGEDGFRLLKEIQQLGSAIDKGQSVARGSQTAFTAKLQALVVSVATGNIPLAASIAGGDAVMSRLFNNEWFKTWLTKGYSVPSTLETVGKVVTPLLKAGAVRTSQLTTQE